jgi:excisionase family DNA binding protein
MDEQITVTEAALLYGCSRANMAYLVATGRLPSIRIGKLIVLQRADVLALREARDSREHANSWIEEVSNG